MKKFSNKSPCELIVENMDRSCALSCCPECAFDFEVKNCYWFKQVKIIAICKAPWIGGFSKKTERHLAIVYQCSNCFQYFWFHTTQGHKETLEDLLNEGIIKNEE